MRLFSKINLQTFDEDDQLLFIASRERNWTDFVGIPVVIGITATSWMQGNILFALLCLVFGGLALVANRMHGTATQLRITQHLISASGNLQRIFTTDVYIATSQVTSIDYSVGGENEPSGLYVWQGWSGTCVLPDITCKQAASIRDAIAQKFPEIDVNNRGPVSLLHGDSSGITTLGLSQADSDFHR